MKKHTFAICAYGESPYLEECIQSVVSQKAYSEILLATATPNDYIRGLCEKYEVPMYVNTGEHGITQDWNFAMAQASTPYVTVTHQDDVYCPEFAKKTIEQLDAAKNPIMAFTDYGEIRDGERVDDSKLLRIKKNMLIPLRSRRLQSSRFVRRRILSLGSPIPCPSVTFVVENCPNPVFQHHFRASEDWEAWEYLSRGKGAFIYCHELLMYHRIHEESETTKIIGDNVRNKEDYEMYLKFWPVPIAKVLAGMYKKSEKSNKLK